MSTALFAWAGTAAAGLVLAVVGLWFGFWIGAIVYNALNYQSASRSKKAA